VKRFVAACAVLAMASCDDVSLHILTAQPYQPPGAGQTLGCLQPSGALDVVGGPATADDCDPTCLVVGSGDAQSLYFTTACGPYPGDYGVETQSQLDGSADPCVGVFAALAADAQCLPSDGGDAQAASGDDGGAEASGDDGGGGEAGDDGGSADAASE
jgi:hypothetical protein